MYNHILSIILFTPLVGAILLLFMPKENKNAIRWVANIFGMLGFAVSLPLVPWFWALKERTGFQFVEGSPNNWIPSIGAGYVLGIDGISFLLIMLTTLLGAISILSSWEAIQDRVQGILRLVPGAADRHARRLHGQRFLPVLRVLGGHAGADVSADRHLGRTAQAVRGDQVLPVHLVRFGADAAGHHLPVLPSPHADRRVHVLAARAVRDGAEDRGPAAIWLFFAFFLGFAIKVPMFPFHTWLPDAHVEAPTAGSVILAGVLLKMGTYGFLRFSLPFFPGVAMTPWVRQFVITLSIIGIIYGALVSLVQKDMKKLVAYSSVSHLGFCTLGIFALSPLGLSGSVIQQINHGISTGALFLIVGILYERRHTREISEYGGISNIMPVYATISLIMFMSSMGLPLLNGFVGEFTILQGTFMENKCWAAWAVPGVILAAAYLLWLYQRVFFGTERTIPRTQLLKDLSAREMATFVPLVILAFCDWPVSQAAVPDSGDAGEQPGGDGSAGLSRTDEARAGDGSLARPSGDSAGSAAGGPGREDAGNDRYSVTDGCNQERRAGSGEDGAIELPRRRPPAGSRVKL